jgi:hypothetical protein
MSQALAWRAVSSPASGQTRSPRIGRAGAWRSLSKVSTSGNSVMRGNAQAKFVVPALVPC